MKEQVIVALAGNPNTGKSTLFNTLTGMKQHTGNWPGKTVAVAYGRCRHKEMDIVLVDLPGTYSLQSNSEEEEIARNFICHAQPDVTLAVVDATCLERHLILVLQILDITKRVVVCVNLMDEAHRKKINIDLEKLSALLGVPVVGISAAKGEGIDKLLDAVVLMASADTPLSKKATFGSTDAANPESSKVIQAEEIYKKVVSVREKNRDEASSIADNLLTSKLFGIPCMFLLLLLLLWITIKAANVPSSLLSAFFNRIEGYLTAFFKNYGLPDWLHGALILGVYRTLAWVVSVMLPPMAIFFPLFTFLEDLGYLPRIAFNLDNYFKKAGAHGKQALTMCMGLGCNAAGVMGCRIIDSPREKLIAIITNSFVPCNGRFPVLITIPAIFLAAYSSRTLSSLINVLAVAAAIGLGVFFTLLVSKILSATLLKGVPSSFVLELPPYRIPRVGKILVRSFLDRTLRVLGRAAAVAAPAGLLIWAMSNIQINGSSLLAHCAAFLDPFGRCLGLDGYIIMAFILGIPANEIVVPILIMSYMASGQMANLESLEALKNILEANGWNWLTAMNFMILCLFHFPCATTLLTIKKETGSLKWTLVSFIVPAVTGILLTLFTASLARILGLV